MNAGLVRDPLTGDLVIGFAVRGQRHKLVNLRARPRATIVFRSGWDWVTAEGDVQIVDAGPRGSVARALHQSPDGSLGRFTQRRLADPIEDWAGIDTAVEQERHSPSAASSDTRVLQPVRRRLGLPAFLRTCGGL